MAMEMENINGKLAAAPVAVPAPIPPRIPVPQAPGYANSVYLYGIYYKKHPANTPDDEGTRYDILFQITMSDDGSKLYIIDTLTGNYIIVDDKRPLPTYTDIITYFVNPIYNLNITDTSFLIPYPNNASINERTINQDGFDFKLFKDTCNPQPILPVEIGRPRYFIKGEYDIDEDDGEHGAAANEVYDHNADREDESAPASLINNTCDIGAVPPSERCTFTDPILGSKYNYIEFRSTDYIEKSEDDYNKLINRLKPIDPHAHTIDEWKRNATYLLTKPIQFYTTVTAINKEIEENFGKHISFNGFEAIINRVQVSSISAVGSEFAVSLIDTIATKDQDIKDRFETVRFIRSYIDLYHDIEDYAREYCNELKRLFRATITPTEQIFLDTEIAKVDSSIVSKSGKINQEKCRQEIERITDVFVEYLHLNGIYTIPKTKESALIISASVDNPAEMHKLIETIRTDGVMGFYVESINNDIGPTLYKQGLDLCNLVIGEWDAGSGFSGRSIKPPPTPMNFGPAITNIARKYINLPNTDIRMFGLFNVTVDNTNNILTTQYAVPAAAPAGLRTFTIQPNQKLSVNRLLFTTNKKIIRGSDSTEVEKIKTKLIEINDTSPSIDRAALISLKTWTDLIQIESMSKLMNIPRNTGVQLKVLTVIYDGLCETTARMYGLGHVLKCQGKIVTYYNYNINSRGLNQEQATSRYKHIIYIANNKDFLKYYLKLWFDQRIHLLQTINNDIYDPILFFVSKLFINKYQTANVKADTIIDNVDPARLTAVDLKLVPATLDEYIESISSSASLLAELLEMIDNFTETFKKYDELGSRGNKDIFLNAYDSIQRLIVTTFGTDPAAGPAAIGAAAAAAAADAERIELRAMVACTFAYMILKKRGTYINRLYYTKQAILHQPPLITAAMAQRDALKYKIDSLANINIPAATVIPRINPLKAVKDIVGNDTNKKILQNIADIEIAIYVLGNVPGYVDYIKNVSSGSIAINPAGSFKNMIDLVKGTINRKIGNGSYFGGKPKRRLSKTHRRKTHKQKRTKRKTYRKRK